MSAALKLAPKPTTNAPTPKIRQADLGKDQLSESKTEPKVSSKKNKNDGWEMTASEALRVNYVESEI